MRNIEQYFIANSLHGYTYYYDLYVYELVKANFLYDLIEYPVRYISSSDDEQTVYKEKFQFYITNSNKNNIFYKYEYEL